jgi:Methyltransferase domain
VQKAQTFRPVVVRNLLGALRDPTFEGWAHSIHLHSLMLINHVHSSKCPCASVAEVGVHHGRFLSMIGAFTCEASSVVAIDLFEGLQAANFDASGKGSLINLRRNFLKLGYTDTDLTAIPGDSTTMNIRSLENTLIPPFGVFSVDGGHSFKTTTSDLVLASKLIHDYGVIIVDDANGWLQTWAGVTDSVFTFLNTQTEIVPFLYVANKIYLCRRHVAGLFAAKVWNDSTLACERKVHRSRHSLGAALGHPTEVCLSFSLNLPTTFQDTIVAMAL